MRTVGGRRVDVCLLQVTQTEMFGYENETFDSCLNEMTRLNDRVEK